MITFERPTEYSSDEELFNAIRERSGRNGKKVLEFLLALIDAHRKIPKNIICKYDHSPYNDLHIIDHRLKFYDPSFLGLTIGVVTVRHGYEADISVHTRHCDKERGDYESGMLGDRTKHLKKAVGLAVKKLQPFQESEIVATTYDKMESALQSWVREAHEYNSVLHNPDIREELQHLVAQGVMFKTPTFKEAVAKLPDYLEYLRRHNMAKYPKVFVIERNGTITVGVYANTKGRQYSSVDELPNSVRTKYSLLRMVGKDTHLPEVGYRVDDSICWLFDVDREELKSELGAELRAELG